MAEPATEMMAPLWWDRLVGAAERFVFEAPVWMLVIVLAAVSLLKDGFGSVSNLSLWTSMAKAFPDRPTGFPTKGNYLFGSPIGPMVAHAIGATGHSSYVALHVAVLVAAVAVLTVGLLRRGGRAAAGVGLVALFASALSNILPTWIGLQDPFTIGFGSCAMLFDSPVALAACGVGLGLSHPGMGAIAVATSVLLRWADRPNRAVTTVFLVTGFLAGYAGTLAYDFHASAGMAGEITFFRAEGPKHVLKEWLDQPFAWLATTFGAFWFFLAVLGKRLVDGLERYVLAANVAVAVVLTFITTDQTRVFALAVWPGVVWLSTRAAATVPPDLLRRVTAITFLLAVVFPRLWIEEGAPVVSAWGHLL